MERTDFDIAVQHERLKATGRRISEGCNRNYHRRENLKFHVCDPNEQLASYKFAVLCNRHHQ
jgi:hypothetical protein